MRRRAALISAGIAAGLAAGMVGGVVAQRRHGRGTEPLGDLPPEDLGLIPSFDGTGLAVRAAGDPAAPVVLLAHGFSLDMSVWCHVWPDLAREARVVAMDFRSHGMSERPANGDLTLRAMGRDVAAVLDAATPDRPAIVVGHSMGAMAVLALAEQRPELFGPRIAGIVLIGAASSDLLRGAMGSVTGLLRPRFGSIQAAALRVDRVRKAVLSSPVDLGGMVTRLTQFGPDTPKPVVDHVVGLARRTPSEVWTDTLPELMEMDLRHAVPRVRVPALVLVGDDDRVTPPAAAVSLAAALPQGRLVVLEEAGHIPMLEQPERLVRELEAFVPTVFGPAAPQASPPRGRRGSRVSPRTLAEVAAEAAGCTRCRLSETRTQVVFGVGDADADLLFIGEAPGLHEDKQGEPFVGAAGQLLTKMLGEIGLRREDVYIANVLRCRPPGNRDPLPDEIESCTPWLVETISIVQPSVIVTLGNFATKFVLETPRGITSMRGSVYPWHGRRVIPTFHPAAILHGGGEKGRQFQDLRADFALIRATLDAEAAAAAATPTPAEEPTVVLIPDEQQLELF